MERATHSINSLTDAVRTLLAAVAIAATLSTAAHAQKFKDLALTPPMGWNSWNKFGPNVNEQMIREMADAMVSSGMKAAGYEFINIDDTWEGYRDSLGFIHPDSTRFPHGMKAKLIDCHQDRCNQQQC